MEHPWYPFGSGPKLADAPREEGRADTYALVSLNIIQNKRIADR